MDFLKIVFVMLFFLLFIICGHLTEVEINKHKKYTRQLEKRIEELERKGKEE